MGTVIIWHPGLDMGAEVDEGAVHHYRASGWLLRSEHEANQRETAERAAGDQVPQNQPPQGQPPAGARPGTGRGTTAQQHETATNKEA